MRLFPTSARAEVAGADLQFPSSLVVPAGGTVKVTAGDNAYGYCAKGGTANVLGRSIALMDGMIFAVPGPAEIESVTGFAAIRHGFSGLTSFGFIEREGRLPYIDGCSDTLLVAPPVLGDPCLNYLFMPAGTRQTMHTHPSVRIGMIVAGSGWCVTPAGRQPLAAAQAFILAPDEAHCFHTDVEAMHIVVYHPDSDFGPAPKDHPMINKTMLGGGRT